METNPKRKTSMLFAPEKLKYLVSDFFGKLKKKKEEEEKGKLTTVRSIQVS
jgi:hypothetical protein